MPRAKKAESTSTSTKVNKSAWIRDQPPALSAKEVVEKAAKAGIKLTATQVYTARRTDKKTEGGGKPGRRGRVAKVVQQGTSELSAIRRAVFEHGFGRVEAFLADLKKSVGL